MAGAKVPFCIAPPIAPPTGLARIHQTAADNEDFRSTTAIEAAAARRHNRNRPPPRIKATLLSDLTPLDAVALAWFLGAWIAYTAFADRRRPATPNLMQAMVAHRQRWTERMLVRENRVVDCFIVGALSRSVSFFASTSIFILAGLVAVLGATEEVIAVVGELPFAVPASKLLWEVKVVLLLTIFVYAFFKFTWSLRQYNYCSVLIGAAPLAEAAVPADAADARRVSMVADLATKHFNRGLRAYYFGLAALSWFVHPSALIAVSSFVVLVLYRREFRSNVLKILVAQEPGPRDAAADNG
jgi:uncharacterized membrane protein